MSDSAKDPWRDAVAVLMFAVDPNPSALDEVLSMYEDAGELRRLLTCLSIVLSAAVASADGGFKTVLRARLEEVALVFVTSPD